MKFFSFILSIFILFQSIGFESSDFLQLTDFIQHAQFHKTKYGDSLFEFVSKHYGDLKNEHNKTHEEERKEHDKLPFQHKSNNHYRVVILTQFTYEPMCVDNIPVLSKNIFFYKESKSSVVINKRLQPPKHS